MLEFSLEWNLFYNRSPSYRSLVPTLEDLPQTDIYVQMLTTSHEGGKKELVESAEDAFVKEETLQKRNYLSIKAEITSKKND